MYGSYLEKIKVTEEMSCRMIGFKELSFIVFFALQKKFVLYNCRGPKERHASI